MKLNLKKEDLQELYVNQQKSLQEIASIYNCCDASVANYLKMFNIPLRKYVQSQDTRNKISETLKKNYREGYVHPMKDKHHSLAIREKLSQYKGDKNSQWGVKWTEERKQKSREKIKRDKKLSTYLKNRTEKQRQTQLSKAWITKKANGTVSTSRLELSLYEELKRENVNKTIYRNYKCDRYPFYCDFYIVEDDLFIELNAHWTHGGKPFDPNDNECIEKLKDWTEKAKTSKFYENAIYTWTVRDVEKQKVAKENNLNYKVIY